MLYNRVRTFRKLYGLTQHELGRGAGVSSQLISEMERDPGKGISSTTMDALCRYFGAPLDRMFYLADEPEVQSSEVA